MRTVPSHFRGYWQRGGALQQQGGSHLFNALCHYRQALSLFQATDQPESMAKYAAAIRAASAQVAKQLTEARGRCGKRINVSITDAENMQKSMEYMSAARTHVVCAWAFELVGDLESMANSLVQAASCENDAQNYTEAAALAERGLVTGRQFCTTIERNALMQLGVAKSHKDDRLLLVDAITCFEQALGLGPGKRQYRSIEKLLDTAKSKLGAFERGTGENGRGGKPRRNAWLKADLEYAKDLVETFPRETSKAKNRAEKRRRQRLKKAQTAAVAEAEQPLGQALAHTEGTQASKQAAAHQAKITAAHDAEERAGREAEVRGVQMHEQCDARLDQEEADKQWLRRWLDEADAGGFYNEFVSRGWTNHDALKHAASDRLAEVMQQPTRTRLEAFRLECALHELLRPGETHIWTENQMRDWDNGDASNAGVVGAWLGTLEFAAPELDALMDVDLEGEDLVEATDESLKGLCKKTAKQAEHKGLDWAHIRTRLISARDVALGRPANGLRIGQLMVDKDSILDDGGGTHGSRVYKGIYGEDKQECAVKQMLLSAGHDQETNLWAKEVNILLKVKGCKHLIEYFGREQDSMCVYLAMEYADGGTLAKRCADGLLGSWDERKAVCRQLCHGLLDLHRVCSIVHCDLKPQNVLFKSERTRVGRSMVLKIADFGLSRAISMSQSHRTGTHGGAGAGTNCWIPPEGLNGFSMVQMPSLTFSYDVHPCGSLLFYILSGGHHAFQGRNESEINLNIINGKHKTQLPQPGRAGEEFVESMEHAEAMDIIASMLHVDPKRRPSCKRSPEECMAAVLAHPFFLSATKKLDRVDLLHEIRPQQWKMLSRSSFRSQKCWHKPLAKLVSLMDGSYGRDSLQELVRLLRNVRAHWFEKFAEDATGVQAVFGRELPGTAKGRDELLVEYVGQRLPGIFLDLLQNTEDWRL
jgi:serine/threonine protein kinase